MSVVEVNLRRQMSLPKSPAIFLLSGKMLGVSILVLLVMSSALLVVYVKHLHRSLHIQLSQAQKSRDNLHIEWSQLLLEQGTWASDVRVEKVAREELNMITPPTTETVVMQP